MRALDTLRDIIRERYEAGEITEEECDKGLKLITKVEAYLI